MICIIFGSDMKMKDFLNKNKKGITFGIVTVIVLAAAFFIGGNNNKTDIPTSPKKEVLQVSTVDNENNTALNNFEENTESHAQSAAESIVSENKTEEKSKNESGIISSKSEKTDKGGAADRNSDTSSAESPTRGETPNTVNNEEGKNPIHNDSQNNDNKSPYNKPQSGINTPATDKTQNEENEVHDETETETFNKENTVTNKSETEAPKKENTATNKSETGEQKSSQSEKSQSEISKSVSNEQESSEDDSNYCTFYINCTTALNSNELNDKKRKLLPSDGYIIKEAEVSFEEGESAFDVLKRVCRNNNIILEFSITPMTNAAYIEGINNLYEFDCGSLSGWTYSVNGTFPNVGCSEYILSDGDKVEFLYTCNLGADVGNYYRG